MGHTGEMHQTKLVGLCEYMTDASWAGWDPKTCVEPISCPYYCQCKRFDGSEWEYLESGKKPHAVLAGEQWVFHDRPSESETYYFEGGSVTDTHKSKGWTFDEWISREKPELVFQVEEEPKWPVSTVSGEAKMFVSRSVQITPGKMAHDEPNNETLAFKRDAKNIVKDNCMKEGITLGRSTAFITAVMCEMLRAYTVKSIQPAHTTFLRNNMMHLACGISFLCSISLTIIPGVREIFKLLTPDWFFYKIAFVFAFTWMIIDEISKYFYRRALANRKKTEAARVKQDKMAKQMDMIENMLHNMEAGRAK